MPDTYTTGKGAADASWVIDAMHLLHPDASKDLVTFAWHCNHCQFGLTAASSERTLNINNRTLAGQHQLYQHRMQALSRIAKRLLATSAVTSALLAQHAIAAITWNWSYT